MKRLIAVLVAATARRELQLARRVQIKSGKEKTNI
jgi:hypothetical protein